MYFCCTEDDRLSLSEVSLLIERQWTPFEERKQSFLHDLRRCRRKKGPMTRDELRQILQRGNAEAMSNEDIDYVFKRLDLNHDKLITEEGMLVHCFASLSPTLRRVSYINSILYNDIDP